MIVQGELQGPWMLASPGCLAAVSVAMPSTVMMEARQKSGEKRGQSGLARAVGLFIVIFCLFCTPARGVDFDKESIWDVHLNFSDYNTVLQEVNRGRPAWLSNNSTCGFIPPQSVILTYSNGGMFDFVLLQQKAMEVGGSFNCLREIFVVICTDTEALRLCRGSGFKHCAELRFPMATPRSEYKTQAYVYMTYIKNPLARNALNYMKEVYIFDSDVLVFKNPFPETREGRVEPTGKPYYTEEFEFRFQRLGGRGPACHGTVNSGQMWFRNTTGVLFYFEQMEGRKGEIKANLVGGQDIVQRVVSKDGLNLSRCVLNPNKFLARGFNHRNYDSSKLLADVVTYHSAGGKRGLHWKTKRMDKIIKDYPVSPRTRISTYASLH